MERVLAVQVPVRDALHSVRVTVLDGAVVSDMFGLTDAEFRTLKRMDSPRKIQDFLESIPINFKEESCMSPRRVLREGRAQCVEGALLAALALRIQGHPPLLLDLATAPHDFDHVVAPFKQHGRWGAISKTNHPVLRYREPVYRDIRELVMSYFHEYFDDEGKKTLRSFSKPINLSMFDANGWMTDEEDLWYLIDHLFKTPHTPILSRAQIATLRRADPLERKASALTEWKRKM